MLYFFLNFPTVFGEFIFHMILQDEFCALAFRLEIVQSLVLMTLRV